MSSPVDLVLHIGTGKAGSSSIQAFLRDNRERVRELGWLYPTSPGQARHLRLGLFTKSAAELELAPEWSRQKTSDPVRFRKTFRRRLLAEVEQSGLSRLLLSDETLFGCPEHGLRRLRRFTDRIAKSLRLVVYLRRQDDHMVSRYQQGVKVGWVNRLSEWSQEDMSSLYAYDVRLRQHQQLMAPARIVVRPFESDRFVGGSLYQDFIESVGIDARADDWDQVPLRNTSLDAESVEFLRLLNLYRLEHEAAVPGLIDNRRLVRRLVEASDGPVLTLPTSFLDEFMSRWEESNQQVARHFLGDPTGQLFRNPRKTANTTTEQRLDPARLDHFLDVSELPEDLHAPLRWISEREATIR